jgi:hypothetical protein
MLDVSFDELWKRHERERKRKLLITAISTPLMVSLIYYFAVPISLTVELADAHHHLPMPESAVVMVNGAEYPLVNIDTTFVIGNLPGYYRGRGLSIKFSAKWYIPINENVSISWGLHSTYKKTLQRDNTFSEFSGKVIDEKGQPIVGATINMGGNISITDNKGHFSFIFPLSKQSETKEVRIVMDGYKEYMREDECPDSNLTYILRK